MYRLGLKAQLYTRETSNFQTPSRFYTVSFGYGGKAASFFVFCVGGCGRVVFCGFGVFGRVFGWGLCEIIKNLWWYCAG